jgi:hypothetical protein
MRDSAAESEITTLADTLRHIPGSFHNPPAELAQRNNDYSKRPERNQLVMSNKVSKMRNW